jgi:hypothetical protein
MADATSRAADPGEQANISRDILAEMDEAATSREHRVVITWRRSDSDTASAA